MGTRQEPTDPAASSRREGVRRGEGRGASALPTTAASPPRAAGWDSTRGGAAGGPGCGGLADGPRRVRGAPRVCPGAAAEGERRWERSSDGSGRRSLEGVRLTGVRLYCQRGSAGPPSTARGSSLQ